MLKVGYFTKNGIIEIWYINLRKPLEIETSLTYSNESLTGSKSRVDLRHYAADCMASFNAITVEDYAVLFTLTAIVMASDLMTAWT